MIGGGGGGSLNVKQIGSCKIFFSDSIISGLKQYCISNKLDESNNDMPLALDDNWKTSSDNNKALIAKWM